MATFVQDKIEDLQPPSILSTVCTPTLGLPEDPLYSDFGADLYGILEVQTVKPSIQRFQTIDPSPMDKAEEDRRIRALVETPVLDWLSVKPDSHGHKSYSRRGLGGKILTGRAWLESKTPPPGYICHRCKEPGHYIKHCHTNGDPNYDIKKLRAPVGIPKSMLMATPDGFYTLPDGGIAALKPDEATFEREMEGLPSTCRAIDLPQELHCPLCKQVMRDAAFTRKCCFSTFCDKCIRDHIISTQVCVCSATDVLADDLVPNITVREAIDRMLSYSSSSGSSGTTTMCSQGSYLAHQPILRPINPSSTSKEEVKKQHPLGDSCITKESGREIVNVEIPASQTESINVKDPAPQPSAPEVLQEKLPAVDVSLGAVKGRATGNYNEVQLDYNHLWADGGGMLWGFDVPFTHAMGYNTAQAFAVPCNGVLQQGPRNYVLPTIPPRFNPGFKESVGSVAKSSSLKLNNVYIPTYQWILSYIFCNYL